MLQQEEPEDFVLATNETHSIREFIEKSFKVVGIELRSVLRFSVRCPKDEFADLSLAGFGWVRWEGEGIDEVAYDTKTGKAVLKIDEKYFRPAEVDLLWGDGQCSVSFPARVQVLNEPSVWHEKTATKAETKLGWKRTVDFDTLVKEMVEADVQGVAHPIEDQVRPVSSFHFFSMKDETDRPFFSFFLTQTELDGSFYLLSFNVFSVLFKEA